MAVAALGAARDGFAAMATTERLGARNDVCQERAVRMPAVLLRNERIQSTNSSAAHAARARRECTAVAARRSPRRSPRAAGLGQPIGSLRREVGGLRPSAERNAAHGFFSVRFQRTDFTENRADSTDEELLAMTQTSIAVTGRPRRDRPVAHGHRPAVRPAGVAGRVDARCA